MSDAAKRLHPVDVEKFEEAMNDLRLYHEMLLHAHKEAVAMEIDPELIEDLELQADMVQEILLKLKISVVNGSNFDPGGTPKLH